MRMCFIADLVASKCFPKLLYFPTDPKLMHHLKGCIKIKKLGAKKEAFKRTLVWKMQERKNRCFLFLHINYCDED